MNIIVYDIEDLIEKEDDDWRLLPSLTYEITECCKCNNTEKESSVSALVITTDERSTNKDRISIGGTATSWNTDTI